MLNKRHLDVDDIYCSQDAYGFHLSPDGTRWTFIAQFGESVEEAAHGARGDLVVRPTADLIVMPVDGGYPQPLGLSHLPLSRPQWSPDGVTPSLVAQSPRHPPNLPLSRPQWSPDGCSLALGGRDGVWVVSTAAGEAKRVVQERVYQLDLREVISPIRQFRGDTLWADVLWSPDGQRILYVSDDEGTQHIWLVAADGSSKVRVHSLEGQIVSRQWSPEGRRILFTARNWDGNTGGVWMLDLDTGQAKLLCEEHDCFYLRPLAVWSPGGNTILFRSNRTGYAKLWAMQPDGTQVRQLTFGEHDDSLFRLAPDGTFVAYASRAEQMGGEDIWLTPLSGGQARRLTNHPGLNRPLSWGPGGKTIYYFHTSPTEPGDLWCFRLGDHTAQQLTKSRATWLSEVLRWPEEVQVAGADGSIYTLLHKPLDFDRSGTYPAVIWVKGGPTTSSRVAYDPEPRWLANHGYIVACPNYRGSHGFGVAHMNAGALGNAGHTDLEDIATVVNYVQSLSYVDGQRVGITGRSWGGYMTLMAVTHHPDLFRCAVAHAAIHDWPVQQVHEDVRHYSRWLFDGWAYENQELYANRSPVTRADRVKVPLLITHGKADENVPFMQVEAFVSKARSAGVKLETRFYEDEGHSPRRPENRQDYLERTVQFLNQHLKPWDFRTNPRRGQRLE